MAGNTLTDSHGTIATSKQQVSATDIARAILKPLASLKLTVFLLILAVFVTWVITFEQTTLDIWALKNKHFNNFFVYVPLVTFFPLNWFPGRPDIPGGLIVPSGLTIIIAMLINLTAAHMLRFRIQASGARLVLGALIVLASGLLTWAIIFNYQDEQGFGGQPPIAWTTMWKYLQVAVLGLGIASIYSAVVLPKNRTIECVVYSLSGVTLLGLLGFSVWQGEDAFIGDSAMRILWQLAQSTIAAMSALFGCILLFRRKAGIVLLHLGIAGLLVNEIFVTVTNEEHRVTVVEGETTHHADDLRETEFVVIDRSDPKVDRMTVVPGDLLEASDDQIDDDRLPFKIRCVEYFKNSDIVRVGPFAENKADSGIGKSFLAVYKKPSAGADSGSGTDQASAYIELIDRQNNKPIGTYMVSQAAYAQQLVDTLSIGNRSYQIGLRFKTVYTPYSIKLQDTMATYYVGTDTPKWFSSKFVIDDRVNNIESTQKISMNNPLRYRDQTFYQTTYLQDSDIETEGDQELSGIQVVRNSGWMIPYVCCMFVVVGLVAQFQQTLISHLSKTKTKKDTNNEPTEAIHEATLKPWIPTLVLGGICALYFGGQLMKSVSPVLTKAKGSEIRLDLLGKLPVTFDGRVQPLDSFARNLARQMSNRENVLDGFETKQPAIRWFADMMFDANGAYEYQILRVEDIKVQNALGFPKRKGLKYKFSEIRDANELLIELLLEADKVPADQRSEFQNRLYEVYGKSRRLMAVQTSFWGTEDRYEDGDAFGRLEVAGSLAKTAFDVVNKRPIMPFCVPTSDPKQTWLPLSIAIEQLWLHGLAQEYQATTSAELAAKMLDAEIEKMKPEYVKKKIIADLMKYQEIVEGLASKFNLKDPQELATVLERNWHQIPTDLYADELQDATRFVDAQLNQWRRSDSKDEIVKTLIDDIEYQPGQLSFDPAIVKNLMGLKNAYQDGDAKTFNRTLETHLASIDALTPTGYDPTAHHSEISYNYFSPFYVASCIYLFAFVVTIVSWTGFQMPLNRAAFWLIILALTVHLGGVAARVIISGRPPITNLYSSFVVVAAGSVIILLMIELATKLGIGNLLAAASGFGSLLYAWTISINQGDTFTVLRAVLDTQFWLTTHVIIINLGYSATLAAGLVGLALLFGLMFNRNFDKHRRRQFTNIIYGTVCFALLFSFFGTVLGGLWADDSWGRFWGWDPKENGALMIVLWNAVILHARWAGMVKDRGVAALAAIGISVVIWSWEGVNELGVGLHAYAAAGGDADSIMMHPLFIPWVFSIVVALAVAVIPVNWYRALNQDQDTRMA